MNAVWTAARAAVRRRRLQTFVIGLVIFFCTATGVVSLALLDAVSAPFDRAFAEQNGAHAVAAFDPAEVSDAQLTAATTGVSAMNGPFPQVVVEPEGADGPLLSEPLTVAGRADPGGAVDRLDLWRGRWPSAPGEIVLASAPHPEDFDLGPLAQTTAVTTGTTTLRVVGWAYSISGSADGWVTPEQVAALHPTATQMLYRFTGDVSTRDAIRSRLAGVTTGLPDGALLASQPYLVLKEKAAEGAGTYLPFLATFGVLGLLATVIIVGNVVSGAVVSGFRHIGVLKAIGFTPRQVVGVYLTMVTVPAVAGAVLGTVIGANAARPMLADTFRGLGFGQNAAARPWVWIAGLVGAPLIVVLAALLPALRAHRLSAAEAISAGSATHRGRGPRVQRALSGTRLPRSISLGLGLPFARPGRTALTLATLILGVTTVTFATGLSDSVIRITDVGERAAGQIGVRPYEPRQHATTTRSDTEIEAMLRGMTGAARVAVFISRTVSLSGSSEPVLINFGRGDAAAMGYEAQLLEGHWMTGPDQVVAPTQLLHRRGLKVGDRLTVELGGGRSTLTIVGETVRGVPGPEGLFADAAALERLDPDGPLRPADYFYQVQVAEGTDVDGYVAAVRAVDPGLYTWNNTGDNTFAVIVTGFSGVLSVLLSLVTALGVLNTVALNVLDRRRDLGMLKSIGMTPRQVVTMMVASVVVLGTAGGLIGIPFGMLAHRIVVPLAAKSASVRLPAEVLRVWHPGVLLLLVLSGVLIAVVGALIPARAAARLTIAQVLHNE
ncbi:FtsX-like permease family protein [Actinoplanes sp. NPDC051851]|uniref:ABC transporter permease n=1 Tax=Actinoplanes sp. NPDC051851 TaxID=3154753 RepID=UPI003430F1E2